MKKFIFLWAILMSTQALALGQKLPSNPPSNQDLPRFYEVVKNKIFRSAQPSDHGLQELPAKGIKTVLDLRNEDPQQIASEGQKVKALGMNFISIPLSGFFAPSEQNMNRIQELMHDESLQPMLIHCQHGQDRTGLVVGLYRVFTEHVSPQAAKKEMLQYGFHTLLVGLNHYFEEHTGEQ